MGDLLKNGMTWLNGQMKDHVSQTVTYRRQADSNDSVPATMGETEFPKESEEGLTIEERVQDFLVNTEDLTLEGSEILPEPGDEIVVAGIGTFEVFAPSNSEPAWRYSDTYHTRIRIHTREV